MAKVSRHRVNARKQAKRLGLSARRAWMLSLRRKDQLLIPNAVCKTLAALGLPPDAAVYDAKLKELLRGA
jgi:hypothetical protein